VCSVVILDRRAEKLGRFVPDRFARAWAERHSFDEGARVEVVLSKAERDPALRQAALKFHGARCSVCGESDLLILDVHHLDPVAEGQRRTTVRDVVVLCANHHRYAHAEMRAARFSAEEVVESSAAAGG
jgi:predicted HNH restriction endonuclease